MENKTLINHENSNDAKPVLSAVISDEGVESKMEELGYVNSLNEFYEPTWDALKQAGVVRCDSCYRMKAKGRELIFISFIKRDGSGTVEINENMSHLDNTIFDLNSLSITNKTYIACEFNSYVVRFRHSG